MRGDKPEPIKSVGIWLRVSTEDQVRGESPEHHERRARAYAEAKGWRVAVTYRLDAVSGKAVMAHPEAQRMLADVRSGDITGLVFSKLARLARNTKELLEFAEIFRACGADLISLAESIDTSTPAGRLFFTMIAAMAEWEREEIAERVRASVPIRAKMGKPTGGQAPFGYAWRDKKLEVNPDEAPVRVLLYELYAEHRRKKTVARILNERGYRTRKGNRFTDTTITRLIEDPTARGAHRANYTSTTDRKGAWEAKPESEWVWTEVEPIVSEELWERCNGILLSQREGGKRVARKTVQLFAGYAFCHCGEKMYVPSNSPKYTCRACYNKIPVDDLEAVYREQLANFVVSPSDIAAHRAAADDALQEKLRLIERGQAELQKLQKEEDRLFDLYAAESLTKDDFRRRHTPLSERRAQLETELPRLQAEADVLKIGFASQEEALSEARDLYARWEDLPFEERRQWVEAITERIVVGKDDLEILLVELGGTGGNKATRSHGLRAAMSWRRAGYLMWKLARATVTSPVSSG